MVLERKASLTKDFDSDESEMYLINNNHPQKYDFPKLAKAIVDALPAAQKRSFCKISKVQKLITWSNLQTFLKGNAEVSYKRGVHAKHKYSFTENSQN